MDRDGVAPWWRAEVPVPALAGLVTLPAWVGLAAWGLGGMAWWLDLFNHFAFVWAVLAAFGMMNALAGGSRTVAALCGGLALVHGARWSSVVGHLTGPSSLDGALSIASANVLTSNPDAGPLLAWIEDRQPDVVVLVEVDRAWLERLAPLRESHPHVVEVPRSDNFGVAVFSRVPFDAPEVVSWSAHGLPSLTVPLVDGPLLVATHPVPPVSSGAAADRDAHLAALAALLATEDVVVAGDLNVTPWSPHFPGGLGREACAPGTWPSGLPAPLRIPIDHILAGPGRAVVAREVGPPIGSDHRPVMAWIR